MTKYLSFRKGKFLVRNDIESLTLFLKYFLDNPIRTRFIIIRRFYAIISYILLHIFAVSYYTGLISLLIKRVASNDAVDFLIRRRGRGENVGSIYLMKKQNKYKIIKQYRDQGELNNDIRYSEVYGDMCNDIKIPQYVGVEKLMLESDFIKQQNFSKQLSSGIYGVKDAIRIYEDLCSKLDRLYTKNNCLIHHDLVAQNIYVNKDGGYSFIDFSEAKVFKTGYDKYILLMSICKILKIPNKIFHKYFTDSELLEYKNEFKDFTKKRYGNEASRWLGKI